MTDDRSGRISCGCGKSSVTVADGRAVQHFLCGCEDCRQALQWCHIQGGRKPDPIPDLYYLRSDIIEVEGREFLEAFKLRSDGKSTRLYCTNCFSLIAVDHPFYRSSVFLFFPEHCESSCDISLDPAAYIMMGDYSKEIGPKPALDIPMFFNFNFKQERDRFALLKGFDFIDNVDCKHEGKTLTEFLKELGMPKNLDLPKGKNLI
ncbi:MAG: hypothetical protein CFH10_00436 [Alphaproteobacteria bacterium MarineAlpha4_Bin2]|nr:MAG: hypothetical protein CFH10_00436 [Alphaproteobacteria bacterium MarineAlpha4_Bin2]